MKRNELKNSGKMTLDEYKAKYNENHTTDSAKKLLFLLIGTMGLVIVGLLILVVARLFDINEIAGYIGIFVALTVFVVFYVLPLREVFKLPVFQTNINKISVREAKRSNRKVRRQIADHMIELSSVTSDVDWYDSNLMAALIEAKNMRNDDGISAALNEIYNTSVKISGSKMIKERAVQIGLLTIVSPSATLDALIVTFFEMSMVKDLLFLYGFRPSNEKLVRIFRKILTNALIAYGALPFAQRVIGKGLEGIPVLGSLLAAVANAASEGAINGALTVVIGHQTIRYLKNEYHLQEIIEGLDIKDDTDEIVISEVEAEIESKQTKKPVQKKN